MALQLFGVQCHAEPAVGDGVAKRPHHALPHTLVR